MYATKTPVELEKLFDNSEHRRQLIIGAPGIGKTTLCQHLFYRCVQDNGLWSDKFIAVFWIPLRKLKNDSRINTQNSNILAYIVKIIAYLVQIGI